MASSNSNNNGYNGYDDYEKIDICPHSDFNTFYDTKGNVCIGFDSNVPNEGSGHVCIGSEKFTDGSIKLCDVDIRKLVKEVQELKQIVSDRQRMIEALWYAPGMPGYNEGKDDWDKNQ